MCAAPALVLEAHGLLKGKKATAHPAFVSKLADSRCELPSPKLLRRTTAHANSRPDMTLLGCSAAEQRVVVDGNLITSRGPGTALEFALALVEQLYGSEKAKEVAVPMVVNENVGSFMHA